MRFVRSSGGCSETKRSFRTTPSGTAWPICGKACRAAVAPCGERTPHHQPRLCATGKGAALHRHATEEVFIPAKGRIGERRITAGDDPSEADPSLARSYPC